MARTISEIKRSMTERYLADPVIREKYGLSEGDSFDDKFSKVSVENILFSVVATAIFALESIFDVFRTDVEDKINGSIVATIPWYHEKCLAFQYGDALIYNEQTKAFEYAEVDKSKQIVKYAAIRENANGIDVLVSKDDNGRPGVLSNDILSAFTAYLNSIKPAGVLLRAKSYEPDALRLVIDVQYDPMLLNSDGSLIADHAVFPVMDAVTAYVHNITYGGVFNKTRLVDAIQQAVGVIDVVLRDVEVKPATKATFNTVNGNNVTSLSGSFIVESLDDTIGYVQEL